MKKRQLIQLFIAYAPGEHQWLVRVEKHINYLLKHYLVAPPIRCDVTTVQPNHHSWMIRQLQSADLVILLVTPDFLQAPFFAHTLDALLSPFPSWNKQKGEETAVLPIIMKTCDYQTTHLSKFEPLPNGFTVIEHEKPEWVLANIAKDIKWIASALRDRRDIQLLMHPIQKNKEDFAAQYKACVYQFLKNNFAVDYDVILDKIMSQHYILTVRYLDFFLQKKALMDRILVWSQQMYQTTLLELSIVQQFAEEAKGWDVNKGFYITNTGFTKEAVIYAESTRTTLVRVAFDTTVDWTTYTAVRWEQHVFEMQAFLPRHTARHTEKEQQKMILKQYFGDGEVRLADAITTDVKELAAFLAEDW